MDYIILLLLPLGIGIGWVLAVWLKDKTVSHPKFSNQYFRGLNYLINEEQDKAIGVFVQMLENNPETVETHISLGALFRRRGETAKAISIHENIMNRNNLSNEQKNQAQMELGRDYIRAGLLDRAEAPFRDLSSLPDYQYDALKFLNEIYDQEQDWGRAIETAKELHKLNSEENWEIVITQYFCEKAEITLNKGDYALTAEYLETALRYSRECVRANLIWANMFERQGDFKAAVEKYKMIEHQDSIFLSEVLPPLIKSYEKIANSEEIIDYLQELSVKHSGTTLLLTLVQKISETQSAKEAEKVLINTLQHKPSVRGLEYLIAINLEKIRNEDNRSRLMGLQRMMRQLQEEKPSYKCENCGFQAKQMHWQCPGCRGWSSIKPIVGVSGE